MSGRLALIVTLAVLALVGAAACNDGGGVDQPTVTPEPSPGSTVTAEASPAATPSPAATDEATPVATAPPGTRQASVSEDVIAFLQRMQGLELTERNCLYDEESGLMDCSQADLGFVQLDPPVPGTGVECRALLADGDLVGASCSSQEPFFATFYELVSA